MSITLREEITISWRGEKFPLVINMELIARIENRINLSTFVSEIASGEMKNSHAAIIVSSVMREAGAGASIDECYLSIIGGGTVKDGSDVSNALSAFLNAAFPIGKKKTTKQPAKKSTPTKSTVKDSTE